MIRTLWCALGWLGVVAALVFSLGPAEPQGPGQYGDKLYHLVGYAMLMYWWAQLYTTPAQRVRLALALIVFGIAIEGLQSLTPTRTSELGDVLANTAGILIGGWIAYRSANLLQLCSRHALRVRGK